MWNGIAEHGMFMHKYCSRTFCVHAKISNIHAKLMPIFYHKMCVVDRMNALIAILARSTTLSKSITEIKQVFSSNHNTNLKLTVKDQS